MAAMITAASTNGSAASSSATHMQLGATRDDLLGYLKTAGLCEEQLRYVQNMLRDMDFQDIDISIWRMDGGKHDLRTNAFLTAAGLKKRLASEWAIQESSLKLAVGSKCLSDTDVIAAFLSSTDRVVNAIVTAPRVYRTSENTDRIRGQLEQVAPYMAEGQHQHLMDLWEQSCQGMQESCEATAGALAQLSDGRINMVEISKGGRIAKETVKNARKAIRNAMVKRVDGLILHDTLDMNEMGCAFQELTSEAGCDCNTMSQLCNGVRRLGEQRGQEVRRGVRGAAGLNIQNVADGRNRGY